MNDDLLQRLMGLPVRRLTRTFFRQTTPSRQPLDVDAIAKYPARWHRRGAPSPAYAATSGLAAMLELPRQTDEAAANQPLPRRRLSELHVQGFPAVDIANELALHHLNLRRAQLTSGESTDPEAELCREIADVVQARAEVKGLLVPSVPMPRGAAVLVIFSRGFDDVQVGDQQIVELQILPVPEEETRAPQDPDTR